MSCCYEGCEVEGEVVVARWLSPTEYAGRWLCLKHATVYVQNGWHLVDPNAPKMPYRCGTCGNHYSAYFKLGRAGRTRGHWVCGVCGDYLVEGVWRTSRIATMDDTKKWVGTRLGLGFVHEDTTWPEIVTYAGLRLLTRMLGGPYA